MTILEKIKVILGPIASSTEKAQSLNVLIGICKDEAVSYCNLEEYTPALDNVVIQMVLERFNRITNEGVVRTNASGITEEFMNGYSNGVMTMLKKHRKLRVVK